MATPDNTANTSLSGARQRPLRVCIVTGDILLEPLEGNDTAFACTGLAQILAAQGDNVTILYAPQWLLSLRVEEDWWQKWQNYYNVNFLVDLVALAPSPDLPGHNYGPQQRSLAAYHYLKSKNFDVVYFCIDGGIGYYSLLAKETGQYPRGPILAVLACRPFEWLAAANKMFFKDKHDLAIGFMEMRCAEAADYLIAPSRAMLDWMRDKGWALPERTLVHPVLRPMREGSAGVPAQAGGHRVSELVFFGNTEYHRGLILFCDAIDCLVDRGRQDLKITLLGRFARILGEHTGSILLRRAGRWPYEVALQPRMTAVQELAYLRVPGRLAVMPALMDDAPRTVIDCLAESIPFVATAVGGIPELVAEADRTRCLSAPTPAALAERLGKALDDPPAPAAAASAPARNVETWAAFHRSLGQTPATPADGNTGEDPHRPLVSIVIPHYDRPTLLRRAVESVRRQTYPNIEVVLVDDGSTRPESHMLLAELEASFAERKWKIVRQENKYLGAARNNGIRQSSGEFILFLDDDNVLFDHAVESFVRAMLHAGTDICTCLSRFLFDDRGVPDERHGKIWFVPLGGCIDLAFIQDIFGDANAMFRRSIFDRIGYLSEDVRYKCEDWEFFTRATFSGLKLRVIPEPLYWYRSDPNSMYRQSHWYDNRQPIIALFRKFGFAGVDRLYDTILAHLVDDGEREIYQANLGYNPAYKKLQTLGNMAVSSDEALQILADFAANEGRANTAVQILSLMLPSSDLAARFAPIVDTGVGRDPTTPPAVPPVREVRLTADALRLAQLRPTAPAGSPPVGFVTRDDRLYLRAEAGGVAAATLQGACPAGATRAMAEISLDQEIVVPTEFLLLATRVDAFGAASAKAPLGSVVDMFVSLEEVNSGWRRLDRPYARWVTALSFPKPAAEAMDLTFAVRVQAGGPEGGSVGLFSNVLVHHAVSEPLLRRPRLGAPPEHQLSRALSDADLKSAIKLETPYPSKLPVPAFEGDGPGFQLRPRPGHVVVARLAGVFPGFARRLIASVEVAHDEGPIVEFAMALFDSVASRRPIAWTGAEPENCAAFSGWLTVADKWELRDLAVEVPTVSAEPMTLAVAVRLPAGQSPSYNHAFWRKFVLSWDA